MSPRLEGIQRIADLLGDSLVTMENHARSMGPAPGDYSTKIGRGHRDVKLSPQWINSVFLAGVRNDPKSAAVKVPELGNLIPGETAYIEKSQVKFEEPPTGYNLLSGQNALLQTDYTEVKKVHPVFFKEKHENLFDFLCSLVLVTVHWLVEDTKESCPIPNGLKIHITLEPEPMAAVSFFVFENRLIDGDSRAVRYYNLPVSDVKLLDEKDTIPLERAVTISHAHILRLGGIYALSLYEQKNQLISDPKPVTEAVSKPKNEKADNPGRSSAPSETLSHTTSRNDTDMQRKDSLTNSDPSARVCVSSRGLTLKGRSHEYASYQHALL